MHKSLPSTIDYIEMPSRDLAGTRQFFTELFGWRFEDYGPDYSSFDDGRMTGGFFTGDDISAISSASPFVVFYVENLERAAAEVERLGGRITRAIFDFPGGRRLHFTAPGTGEFAIWSE